MGALVNLVLVLGLAVLQPNKVTGDFSRIVGGYDTTIKKYPWNVQIRHGYSYKCGGSLLSDNVVLTVAHCVEYDPNESKSDFMVYAGKQFTRLGRKDMYEQGRHVNRVIMHPRYRHKGLHHDVALLILDTPFNLNGAVQLVQLSDSAFDRGAITAANVMRLDTDSINTPNQQPENLQEIRVNVIPNGYCRRIMKKYKIKTTKITDYLVCSHEKGGICNGDSGGPMGCFDKNGNFRQVGIVSWGPEKSCYKGPAVYTRVTRYRSWITSTLDSLNS